MLLSRLLPYNIAASGYAAIGTINIIEIPADRFIDPEDKNNFLTRAEASHIAPPVVLENEAIDQSITLEEADEAYANVTRMNPFNRKERS